MTNRILSPPPPPEKKLLDEDEKNALHEHKIRPADTGTETSAKAATFNDPTDPVALLITHADVVFIFQQPIRSDLYLYGAAERSNEKSVDHMFRNCSRRSWMITILVPAESKHTLNENLARYVPKTSLLMFRGNSLTSKACLTKSTTVLSPPDAPMTTAVAPHQMKDLNTALKLVPMRKKSALPLTPIDPKVTMDPPHATYGK